MSKSVEITPEGLFEVRRNPETGTDDRTRPDQATVLTNLNCHCELAPGTTLRDIFHAVATYSLLEGVIAQYSWCRAIKEFHAQAEEPTVIPPTHERVDSLEIFHWVSVTQFKHRTVFSHSCGFHGIAQVHDPVAWENQWGYRVAAGPLAISVSATPLGEIAHLVVVLNPTVRIFSPYRRGHRPAVLIEAESGFTFLEVLDAIYDDISFYGGPHDREEMELPKAWQQDADAILQSRELPGEPPEIL